MFNVICLDKDGDIISGLTQWDVNQSIIIEDSGLTTAPHFHFCNKNSEEALVVGSTLQDGKITVKIPNLLLQEPYPIIAYIFEYSDMSSGRSVQRIKIPITPRVKPSDYEYIENIDRITADKIIGDIKNLENDVSEFSSEIADFPNGYASKNHSHPVATTSSSGFLSVQDKIKLDKCLTEHPPISTSDPTNVPQVRPNFGEGIAVLTNLTRDKNGHIINFEAKNLMLPTLPEEIGDVDEKIGDIKMFVGAYPADSKDQPNLTNGIVHLILDTLGEQENRSWMKIYGKDGIEVTTDEDTNIVISGTSLGVGIEPLTDEQIDEICTV